MHWFVLASSCPVAQVVWVRVWVLVWIQIRGERCQLDQPNVSPAVVQPWYRRRLSCTSYPMQVALGLLLAKAQRGINSRTGGRILGICTGFRGRGRKFLPFSDPACAGLKVSKMCSESKSSWNAPNIGNIDQKVHQHMIRENQKQNGGNCFIQIIFFLVD